jgi:hypothetical protein
LARLFHAMLNALQHALCSQPSKERAATSRGPDTIVLWVRLFDKSLVAACPAQQQGRLRPMGHHHRHASSGMRRDVEAQGRQIVAVNQARHARARLPTSNR